MTSTTGGPQIEWVNHASYVVRYGAVALITDPWLFGSAFNDGWDLITPTTFQSDDWARITHIWLSHEHPDHFSPPVLTSIPASLRGSITVLFQKTPDGRVAGFCRKLGFIVKEMVSGQTYNLAENVALTCYSNGTIDSFLLGQFGNVRILNMNDCLFADRAEFTRAVRQVARPVDVMLTQFGYAEKIGNADDPELRAAETKRWLDFMVLQAEVVRPRFTVPFATFKFFSHIENMYMNDHAATVTMARDALAACGVTTPVVLSPGDVWDCTSERDNQQALKRYESAWETIAERQRAIRSVPLSDIVAENPRFMAMVRDTNSPLLLRILAVLPGPFSLRPLTLWLHDIDICGRLSLDHGFVPDSRLRPHSCDIEMASDSAQWCLKFDYGMGTLLVNARCRATRRGLSGLYNMSHVALANSAGKRIDLTYLLSNGWRALRTKLRRRLAQRSVTAESS